MLARGQLCCSVSIKNLLTCPLQLVEIAHLLHAFCKFCAGLRARLDLLCVLYRLLRRYSAYPGLAHLRNLLNHVGAQLHLGLRHLPAGYGLALGERQNIEQAKRQQPLQFQLTAKAVSLKRKNRIGNSSRLIGPRHVGPTLGEQGLHGRAVG